MKEFGEDFGLNPEDFEDWSVADEHLNMRPQIAARTHEGSAAFQGFLGFGTPALARKRDGSVVTWGFEQRPPCTIRWGLGFSSLRVPG